MECDVPNTKQVKTHNANKKIYHTTPTTTTKYSIIPSYLHFENLLEPVKHPKDILYQANNESYIIKLTNCLLDWKISPHFVRGIQSRVCWSNDFFPAFTLKLKDKSKYSQVLKKIAQCELPFPANPKHLDVHIWFLSGPHTHERAKTAIHLMKQPFPTTKEILKATVLSNRVMSQFKKHKWLSINKRLPVSIFTPDPKLSVRFSNQPIRALTTETIHGGTLREFIIANHHQMTPVMWNVIYFQVLFTLHQLQMIWPYFRHNDLHVDNIFVEQKLNLSTRPQGYVKYTAPGSDIYFVPFFGFTLKLWDFEASVIDPHKWVTNQTQTEFNPFYDLVFFITTLMHTPARMPTKITRFNENVLMLLHPKFSHHPIRLQSFDHMEEVQDLIQTQLNVFQEEKKPIIQNYGFKDVSQVIHKLEKDVL